MLAHSEKWVRLTYQHFDGASTNYLAVRLPHIISGAKTMVIAICVPISHSIFNI